MTWKDTTGLVERLEASLGAGGALWLTTNPGLEDLVADELVERLAPLQIAARTVAVERRPLGFGGHVLALLPRAVDAEVEAAAGRMRSVHHVVTPLYGFALPGHGPEALDAIAAELARRGVPDLEAAPVDSFRVTTRRSGEHRFTSMDVQRRAGAVLVQRYGLAVDLTEPDCEVRVDVAAARCLVGVHLTRASLSRRKPACYHPRGALKANVAYAMLRLARLDPGAPTTLLDPFCGSGTIPIEAARVLPAARLHASDYAAAAVDGARRNLEAAGLGGRVQLACREVGDLPGIHPAGAFDAIVTNPPFGVRLGRGMNFTTFYRRFLEVAAHLLRPGGPLVFLAWKRGVVDKANRPGDRFRRNHVRVVETGGIYPRIYVMERRADAAPPPPDRCAAAWPASDARDRPRGA